MNVGERIGDYEIVQVLGAGGMGQVYKVRNVLSDRIEAMKVLLPNLEGDPGLVDRFLREIKTQAALDHPHIARLNTAQVYNNQLLMVMEYVEGSAFDKLLHYGPMGVRDTALYAVQVLDALDYAHSRGVVHRDIKPANIMRTPQGTVKLMDFGIARMQSDRKLTQTGHTVGSLYYMSPEQIKGGQPDPRSDLYSLGITLYEMVTGRKPFEGESDFYIMSAHLQQMPVAPIDVIPGIPSQMSDVIVMALAKDPSSRFQSAAAMKGALESVLQGAPQPVAQTVAMPQAPTPPLPPPVYAQPAPPPYAAPAAASASPSRRGLYMTLGSIVTVGVIIAAVIMVPKFQQASAVEAPVVEIVEPPPPVGNAPTGTPPAEPAPDPTALTSPRNQPAANVPVQTPTAVPQANPVAPSTRPAPPVTAQQPRTQTPTPATQAAAPPPQVPVQQIAPQTTQVPAAPPAVRTVAPSPEMGELREHHNLLAVRVGTAKGGLRTQEQQMRRQGLDLRGDIVEAENRMDYLMKEAIDSLRSGDTAAARRNLQMAERALESIEKFIGR